jgi:hypothetical protein
MARAAPPKSTTYGNKGRGKLVPTKKVPSPTPDDDNENKEDDSIVGKLLDELDDDSPPKSRSTRAKAPPTKPKTAMKSPRKVNPPSLPPSSKVIPKSKLSKEIKPSPPSKATSKGNESESDYDTDEEEEKVKAKSQPKPLKGKKTDNSKLPSSNGSSTKSSLQSKSSSSTREKKALAKKEDTSAPHPLSDDLDDEFGPAFDIAMVDAVDKVLESQGLSSSPTITTKGKKAPSPISPLGNDTNADEIDNVDEGKGVEGDSPLSDAGAEEEDPKEGDEIMSSHGSNSESASNSQSPEPKSRNSVPRAQKLQALKRQAEYDSNEISDSEGGTAGLVLADLSPTSPSKKARISAPPAKSAEEVVESINKAVRTLSSRRPASIPPTVIKSARGKKAVGPPLPAIDYEAMVAPYGKEVVQRLMLKQFDSIKKCDWFELSVELAEQGVTRAGDKKKGKKGKETIISANELHELFHNVRLPSLA